MVKIFVDKADFLGLLEKSLRFSIFSMDSKYLSCRKSRYYLLIPELKMPFMRCALCNNPFVPDLGFHVCASLLAFPQFHLFPYTFCLQGWAMF